MMRNKNNVSVIFLLFAFFLIAGCSNGSRKPDFGTEVINDKVQLPEIAYKEDKLACYLTEGRTVYTLGTRHQKHFYPQAEYSLQDIQSVIENTNPDYVFIECREEIFNTYQVLDGPQEFQYPESMMQVLQKCIDYYEDGFMDEVYENVTDMNAVQLYKQLANRGVKVYENYKELVGAQQLYY